MGTLMAIFKQVSGKDTAFKRDWAAAWDAVADEMAQSLSRVPADSAWRPLAPKLALLASHVGMLQWQEATVMLYAIASSVEDPSRVGRLVKWLPLISVANVALHAAVLGWVL